MKKIITVIQEINDTRYIYRGLVDADRNEEDGLEDHEIIEMIEERIEE